MSFVAHTRVQHPVVGISVKPHCATRYLVFPRHRIGGGVTPNGRKRWNMRR